MSIHLIANLLLSIYKGIHLVNLEQFLSHILDSITEHIVVINEAGDIQYVNKSWTTFGGDNTCNISQSESWIGVNYIEECDKAASLGDNFGENAAKGIRSIITKQQSIFYFEYPCHSPEEKRWFMMRATPFELDGQFFIVISHQNITERKLAEEDVRSLARIDGLTGIANRRTFNEFFHDEWRRCARLEKNLCLAIVDLDHFKALNDTLGHQAGDECLVKVAEVLKQFTNRPTDLCARYGGDEFVLVLGDTRLEQANHLLNKLLIKLDAISIANKNSSEVKYLTASIGVAEAKPYEDNNEDELLGKADLILYLAKKNGRNRVET